MELFISNTTLQRHRFRYSRDKGKTPLMEIIEPGKQFSIKDLNSEQIEDILNSHKGDTHEYMVEQKHLDMTRNFVGLVYRIGSPVEIERTAGIIEDNNDIRDQLAHSVLEDTVAVIAHNLNAETGDATEDMSATVTEVEKNGEGATSTIQVENQRGRGRPRAK